MQLKMYELVPLHHTEEYFERCFQLLNHQWPRLASVRMGMLRLSRDTLPTSLVLVEDHKVIGHIKIKQLFSRCRALWLESVVIDKALRGKGYGKILMLETEKYARKMGFELAYLATYDQQGFYSHLGYEECEKVCVFDKPIGDEWVPDTSFLKEMSWNMTHSKNGFSKLSIGNCNGTSLQNGNGTFHKPKSNGYTHQKHSSTNGYHHKSNYNLLEGSVVQIDEDGWHEIEVKTVNGDCPASSAIPEPPPPPPRPAMPLQYLNGIPVPPAPPPPPPKAPSVIPPFKKIPAVSLSPIKEGVAVPAPPPKSDSEANHFLLISSLLSNDGEGIKTFMKKSLI